MAVELYSTCLRASLLLPHDFSLFVKWQKEHSKNSDIGYVCDAMEYHRFIKYRDAFIDHNIPLAIPSNPHTASKCGHTYHPSNMRMHELCPICEVQAHLSFLGSIVVAWNKAGGPRLRPGSQVARESCGPLRKGWHTARLQLQNLLDMFVIMAKCEETWEADHPSEAASARQTSCASAAVRLAQEESRYPACLGLSPTAKAKTNEAARWKKKVAFAPEVQIEGGEYVQTSATKFIHGRSQNFFYRRSPTYKPGEYACPTGSAFVDTSQEGRLFAKLGVLKLYTTDDEDAFDSLPKSPHFNGDLIGRYQGIVGLHDMSDTIFRLMHECMAESLQQEKDFKRLIEQSDRIVVLIDDETGRVVDFVLLDGSKEEDGDDQQSSDEREKGKGQGDWTCLEECLR
ncbi:hypothetical protein C7974DRAFT_379426 [Boeremia exigua]|uniref:uncharacterized protein n=1 Tax=Boeremia exigua TaxID=749465 RepID=UPI001E8EEC3D|nr:uncharacterized protein C7974DRAFT_379426 [Boeremia exigua]KAH6616536.1 hypothetical protein C7974DRAFT_379426 [Boeremia exigua]